MVLAQSSDNNLYVNQVGSGSTVSVTQQGNGNNIGGTGTGGPSTGNAAVLSGGAQTVTINQIGNDNSLQVNLTDVTSGTGTLAYRSSGSNNTGIVDSTSTGAGNFISSINYGSSNATNTNIQGNNNVVSNRIGTSTASSNSNTLNNSVNGDNNVATTTVRGGDSNSVTVIQGMGSTLINTCLLYTSDAADE